MLPPTMMMAPTSAIARPKAARKAVSSEVRPQREQQADAAQHRQPVDSRQVAILRPQQARRPVHQCDDDRCCEQRLRDHHRRRREQQAGRPERAGARQQKIEREPDHDRRKTKQRIGQDDDDLPPAEPGDRKQGSERRPDQKRDDAGGQADAHRQSDDAQKLCVGLADQRECGADGSREVVHPCLSVGARHDVSGASISGLRR
ncbi:hypothetical protein ACVWZZ_001306 [Bradyrhizobium sp. LM6.10]